MNKIIKIVTGALSVFCLASCGNNVSKTEEKAFQGTGYVGGDFVAVKELNEHLILGEKGQLKLEGMPQSYLSQLTFESKDSGVVTVSATGELTPVAKGKTIILVKHPDGKVAAKVNVIVTGNDDKDVASTVTSIKNAYANPSYQEPTSCYKLEYSYENYYKDDVLHHGYTSFEECYYDKDSGYFMYGGDDIWVNTRGGAKELSSGTWIFTVLGYSTRMLHITDTAKNYFDFNSAKYSYANDVIFDILDMFFVSGKKIVTDMMGIYAGKEDFDAFTTDSSVTLRADGKNDFAARVSYTGQKGVVETEDELQYLDMYEGTEYVEDDDISVIYEGAKCTGYSINAVYKYTFENASWRRDFRRSMAFFDGYTPVDYDIDDKEMKDAGWAKVDNMYDL